MLVGFISTWKFFPFSKFEQNLEFIKMIDLLKL